MNGWMDGWMDGCMGALLTSLAHGPLIRLLPERHQPGHLVSQEQHLEIGVPSRHMLAVSGPRSEVLETETQVFVILSALDADGAELPVRAGDPGAVVVGDDVVRQLASQVLEFCIEDLGAGVGVEQAAVGDLELVVAFVEAPARVGHVVHAFELARGQVGAREGDELVDEEVVEGREGFDDGGGGGVGGEGDAGLEDLVGRRRAVVEDGVHKGHGCAWGRGAGDV